MINYSKLNYNNYIVTSYGDFKNNEEIGLVYTKEFNCWVDNDESDPHYHEISSIIGDAFEEYENLINKINELKYEYKEKWDYGNLHFSKKFKTLYYRNKYKSSFGRVCVEFEYDISGLNNPTLKLSVIKKYK